MLDKAQVLNALAARDIVPDATQRDAIAALVALPSNYAPDTLLSDPEFHERFLPTIEQHRW
jgi:hypothetical protein